MKTETKRYNVVLKHVDNSISYLTNGGRIEWAYRTAKRHCNDITERIARDGFGTPTPVRYASVLEA